MRTFQEIRNQLDVISVSWFWTKQTTSSPHSCTESWIRTLYMGPEKELNVSNSIVSLWSETTQKRMVPLTLEFFPQKQGFSWAMSKEGITTTQKCPKLQEDQNSKFWNCMFLSIWSSSKQNHVSRRTKKHIDFAYFDGVTEYEFWKKTSSLL